MLDLLERIRQEEEDKSSLQENRLLNFKFKKVFLLSVFQNWQTVVAGANYRTIFTEKWHLKKNS